MIDFIDKTQEQSGTPINRQNMMAIQGFQAKTITANADGSVITCINDDGNSLITTFDANNAQIIEIFTGEKVITKTTSLKNGAILEVIS
jgi:hypothetical protein